MQCQYCRGQMFPYSELGERPFFKCLQCSRVVSNGDAESQKEELRCPVCKDGPYYNSSALAAHERRCGNRRTVQSRTSASE